MISDTPQCKQYGRFYLSHVTCAGTQGAIKVEPEPANLSQQSDDEPAAQLVAVLAGDVTQEAAVKLLRQCGGNLQRAVNAHYDSLDRPEPAGAKVTNPVPRPRANPAVRLVTATCHYVRCLFSTPASESTITRNALPLEKIISTASFST